MNSNFLKAQSDNLPMVDAIMVGIFMNTSNFISSEMRGVKAKKSAESSYGDAAIGYVQLKREGSKCIVKGSICPEHRVRDKPYNVTAVIDEVDENVDSVECHDCAASLGGCKHAVAFLMFLHRRSEEPPPTAVECYWKKSRLSSVGSSVKLICAKDLAKRVARQIPEPSNTLNFLQEYLARAPVSSSSSLVRQMSEVAPSRRLSVWQAILSFVQVTPEADWNGTNFLLYSKSIITKELCDLAESATTEQSKSALWFELRYARITASKIYSAAHCHTPDGSFVEQVIGSLKIKDTKAMKRGRELEERVLEVVAKREGLKIVKCGLQILPDYFILGASPDAVSSACILEVKCPMSAKSYKTYKTVSNKIAAKYNAQVQLQMFASKKAKALFCLADPAFEENGQVEIIYVDQDVQLTMDLIEKAIKFWTDNIFKILLQAATKKLSV